MFSYVQEVCILQKEKMEKNIWELIADWRYLALKLRYLEFLSIFGRIYLHSAFSPHKYFFTRQLYGPWTFKKCLKTTGILMLIPGNGPRNHEFSNLALKAAVFPGTSNIFTENQFLDLNISS